MSGCPEKILFPLSSKYDENWIRKNSLGENVLYNLETLCNVIKFEPGMRVLDLGCGKALSGIFLAKEFGVKVFAIDPKVSAAENYSRVKDMGAEEMVIPLKLDARSIPFPCEYFDVIIAVDSFMYYGTDQEYTQYIMKFLKPGGQIGIVDICFNCRANSTKQDKLVNNENLYFLHSLEWWYELWQTSGVMNVEIAEIVPENNFIRSAYIKDNLYSNKRDIIAEELSKDTNELINVFRMIGKKYQKDLIKLYTVQ